MKFCVSRLVGFVVACSVLQPGILHAQVLAPFQLLHTLTGAEGSSPAGGLVTGPDNQLYGTTDGGGSALRSAGGGNIFRLASDGTLKVWKSFPPVGDPAALTEGSQPVGLMRARDGNLYGTTESGGLFNNGTIYRLSIDLTTGAVTHHVVHSFNCATGEGIDPYGALTEGPDGALYGVTIPSGNCATNPSYAAVFKIDIASQLSPLPFQVLATLDWTVTGSYQFGSVVVGHDLSVYGTTIDASAAAPQFQFGSIFKVSPSGALTRLHVFNLTTNPGDGANPLNGLVRGYDGAMYGTTSAGAIGGAPGGGTIFRVTEDGSFQTLYSFQTSAPCAPSVVLVGLCYPNMPLVAGGDGKLYGATDYGGAGAAGGTFVFDTVTNTYTIHHEFTAGTDGDSSDGPLAVFGSGPDRFDGSGGHIFGTGRHLYGTNASGGSASQGTVFGLLDVTIANRPPDAVATASPNPAHASPSGTADVTLSAAGSSDPDFDPLTYQWTLPAGTPIVSGSLTSPTLVARFPNGTSHVSLAVSDGQANSTASGDVLVRDLIMPANPVLEATGPGGAVYTYSASGSNAAGTTVAVNCSPASGLFSLGTTTVTCTGPVGGISTTETFSVTVVDTTPPVMTMNINGIEINSTGPRTVVNFEGGSASFPGSVVTASDLVDGAVTPVCTPPSGFAFPLGRTHVTCIAIDAHGNSTVVFNDPVTGAAFSSFDVVVRDGDVPVIALPANIVIEATGPGGAVATFTVRATDLSDPTGVVVSCDRASGSTFPLGTTTVTCTAKDSAGNTSPPGSFTITVQDTTPPALTVPAAITRTATSATGAVVTFSATAIDLVSGARQVTCAPPSGSVFPVGVTTVNCAAVDAAGNSATKSFTVTITRGSGKGGGNDDDQRGDRDADQSGGKDGGKDDGKDGGTGTENRRR
jgi:uncharacterized repeat protein (TIGR03803 family)